MLPLNRSMSGFGKELVFWKIMDLTRFLVWQMELMSTDPFLNFIFGTQVINKTMMNHDFKKLRNNLDKSYKKKSPRKLMFDGKSARWKPRFFSLSLNVITD
eukprot:Lithocolla_globosa_v1_NODE_2441_length_2005_cov_2.974359.p3 type:complete len:101 gc:universal NODE_2441_length_2005_cov_2.974359:1157-1459(+)